MQDNIIENIDELKIQAEDKALEAMEKLKALSVKVALAESCTAGLVSALLANIQGASSHVWGSFVCYTQEAKVSMLDLDNAFLRKYGLVSRETACAMAKGALQKSGAHLAVSVTGLAGPQGDGSNVPLGTVWIGASSRGRDEAKGYHFTGLRNFIRYQAAIAVFEEVIRHLG